MGGVAPELPILFYAVLVAPVWFLAWIRVLRAWVKYQEERRATRR